MPLHDSGSFSSRIHFMHGLSILPLFQIHCNTHTTYNLSDWPLNASQTDAFTSSMQYRGGWEHWDVSCIDRSRYSEHYQSDHPWITESKSPSKSQNGRTVESRDLNHRWWCRPPFGRTRGIMTTTLQNLPSPHTIMMSQLHQPRSPAGDGRATATDYWIPLPA